ncbi:hypothetical protein NMK71_10525 [Weeksellaceae bacterium KMM 9713]|uniref:GIY-YIG catalytic domain-containing protein n=1 Tax=Profundicola chukchiensis TaxID=2961959 RepID=A0A9X4MXT5_9FLAO|nr:hypothetical protein [Profundicola chukchiensis]MDG4946851.1 hypothetical protein [Profundicola chukchiensis]
MSTKEIIEFLREKETDFLKIDSFSKLPGIYAIFYIGNDFPLIGDKVKKHDIIYIGKTESSQEKRDAKTHFTSGKTGSSTVRKSIGSILCQEMNLNPIPRNDSDYIKGRISHFKFDENSEEKITEWMINNLALSFYEYPKSKLEIETLESSIINELIPILNIAKNPSNPYRTALQTLRKNCANMAFTNSKTQKKPAPINPKPDSTKKKTLIKTPISTTIYIDNITSGDVSKNQLRIKKDNKYLFPKEKQGEPNTYYLPFKYGKSNFDATYKIGSKDGKSRSGILKLGADIYKNVIQIKAGTTLKVSITNKGYYILEK